MERLHFTIQINASPEKVWHCLWEIENYKTWTNLFCSGSYYKTDSFTEGSKIHLLTPSGEGMYSVLETVKENTFLALKHLGEIKNFEEMPITGESETWTGAMETYALNEIENGTELTVNVDALEVYVGFMSKTFPLALNELKRISEN